MYSPLEYYSYQSSHEGPRLELQGPQRAVHHSFGLVSTRHKQLSDGPKTRQVDLNKRILFMKTM